MLSCSLELDRLLELARSMQLLDGKLGTSIHGSIFVFEGLFTLLHSLRTSGHVRRTNASTRLATRL